MKQSGVENVSKTSTMEKKLKQKPNISGCLSEPAGNTRYKLVTMFPLYSFSLADALLQGPQLQYKYD